MKYYPDYVASLHRMTGKTIAITGCTSGTGFILAKTCAGLGAKVVMLNRASARSDQAYEKIKQISQDTISVSCDLQSFDSVKAAGEKLGALRDNGLDVLCNNAGVMGLPDMATRDGFDIQMQTNHLSHFLLTSLLWPLLESAVDQRGEARIVNHSSGARRGAPLATAYLGQNGGNLGGNGFPGFGKWKRYQQSKLANLLFTYALHDHITEDRTSYKGKILSLCAHPGPTDSGLQAKTADAGGTGLLDRYILARTLRAAQSVEDGTLGLLRACCEPDVTSASFFGPEGKGRGGPAMLLPAERNSEGEHLVWDETLKSTGLQSFFPA